MIHETNDQQEQEKNLSPFTVEKIEGGAQPKVEIKDHKLFINGEEQKQYLEVATSWGTNDDLKKQKNNSNLVQFQAKTGGGDSKGYRTRVIDITNPTKELLTIDKDEKGDILVNGQKWNSLLGKDIYWGGYRAEVDPEGGKVVFVAGENKG